jgi:hypothetical protein
LISGISLQIVYVPEKAVAIMERQHPCWHNVSGAGMMERKMPAGVPAFHKQKILYN